MKRCLALTALVLACGEPYQNLPFKPDPSLWAISCDDLAIDWQDATCKDPLWQAPVCAAAVAHDSPDAGHAIVGLPTSLTYTDSPPLTGPHRADWARWGEYAYLPPQVWLYNLEVGGIVALYNPCVAPQVVDDLRQWLRNKPNDDSGIARWILTPYPALPTPVALLGWGHSSAATCLDGPTADAFWQAHYRHGPEDIALPGTYAYAWLGRSGALSTAPAGTPPNCAADAGTTDGP